MSARVGSRRSQYGQQAVTVCIDEASRLVRRSPPRKYSAYRALFVDPFSRVGKVGRPVWPNRLVRNYEGVWREDDSRGGCVLDDDRPIRQSLVQHRIEMDGKKRRGIVCENVASVAPGRGLISRRRGTSPSSMKSAEFTFQAKNKLQAERPYRSLHRRLGGRDARAAPHRHSATAWRVWGLPLFAKSENARVLAIGRE